MTINNFIFYNLILLSLVSFGIFGSLSHVFNSTLILILALNLFYFKNNLPVERSAKKLYFAISSVFFIFLVRGMFHSDTWASLESLSPMISIPLIGIMILLTKKDGLNISAQRLENYAKISIITTYLIYIIFSKSLAYKFGLTDHFLGRLEIFSGNPIPFSTAVFGITIFCFSNWKYSKNTDKFVTLTCVFIGFWLAGITSGTRGTLLAVIISIPIVIWFITQSLSLTLLITIVAGSIFGLLFVNGKISIFGDNYIARLSNGLDALINKQSSDYSINVRMELWPASINAIKDNPFWGHDISNRFRALSTHLPETFNHKFTHPHNDIFASAVGAGLIGGILAIFSLLSPLWAALLAKDNCKDRLFLGFLVTLGIMTTANVNTVFFNDITAAWLAFSTFLIWNLNFVEKENQNI